MSSITGSSIEEKTRFLLSLKPSPCKSGHPAKIQKRQWNKSLQYPYSVDTWRQRKFSMSSDSSDQSQLSTPSTLFCSPEPRPTTSKTTENALRKLIDSISEKLEREELNQCSYLPPEVEELFSTTQTPQSPEDPSDIPEDLASIDVSSFKILISNKNPAFYI